jgi:hypothetical protein
LGESIEFAADVQEPLGEASQCTAGGRILEAIDRKVNKVLDMQSSLAWSTIMNIDERLETLTQTMELWVFRHFSGRRVLSFRS